MSAARVPLAYRDSCANLLIPLNKCRYNEYYLPWKCEVRLHPPPPLSVPGASQGGILGILNWARWKQCGYVSVRIAKICVYIAGRKTQLREMPVRGVQAKGEEDGRDQGGEGWGQK